MAIWVSLTLAQLPQKRKLNPATTKKAKLGKNGVSKTDLFGMLSHPSEKICSTNWDHFPNFRDEKMIKIKKMSLNHQPLKGFTTPSQI